MKWWATLSVILFWNLSFSQNKEQIFSSVIVNGYTKVMIGCEYGHGNILWGVVKRIVEIRHLKYLSGKNRKSASLPADTINFSRKQAIVSYSLPIDFLTSNSFNSKFFDKYELSKKQNIDDLIDTSSKIVDRFDFNGNKVGTMIEPNGGKPWDKQDFKFDYTGELLLEFTTYKTNDSIGVREAYKYNKNKLLSSVTDYRPNGQIEEHILIAYEVFDKNGNWTKRIETRKTPSGKITGVVVTERKITYY